ncbi:bacillithiol biosynthesis cysteine-adding enzyme BshC [Candidatus Latescibacterota bacterium]
MFKFIDAEIFFDTARPACIPSDSGPIDPDILVDRIQAVNSADYPLNDIKSILRRENRLIEAGKKALDSIEKIDNETVFVICGQQAGLFGGPLYTLYKAMHAVRLSSILSERTGKQIVPLFWIASDDHDFEEVRSLGIRTNDGSTFRLEYIPEQHTEGAPVGEIVIDDGIFRAIDVLEKHIAPGEFSERYLSIIKSSWQPGIKWGEAFAKQIAALFSEYGLVIFDPRATGAKALFRDIMTAELNDPHASSNLVNTEAATYETSKQRKKAIRKPEGSTNLFLEIDGIRYPLFFKQNSFSAGDKTFSQNEILDLIASVPEKFSPGAVLRPVCQDFIFPTVALISGPGERFYLEQIEPVYKYFNVNRSVPWPRASFTIIDHKIIRISEKETIPLEKMFTDIDSIRTEYAKNTFPENIRDKLDGIEEFVDNELNGIADKIGTIDSTLIQYIQKEKGKILHTLNGIRARAIKAHKSSLEISESRYKSSSYFLNPEGEAQERWFGIDAVVPMFRERGFDELIKLTSPGEELHRIILPDDN